MKHSPLRSTTLALLALTALSCRPSPAEPIGATDGTKTPVEAAASERSPTNDLFFDLLSEEADTRRHALAEIKRTWQPDFTVRALETSGYLRDPVILSGLIELMEKKTGAKHGFEIQAWYEWIWANAPEPGPLYGEFKSRLYSQIDPRFAEYFSADRTQKIRVDEVRWGGVLQDGIPPLRNPKMIEASEASYLEDDHVVFGIEVEGDARAYPKRILAWHEMFVDTVGGVPVTGVYCTLCGTVILYDSIQDGVEHELGTSGFLYRSNKLMYDRATQSLWNTLWGRPVVGPLAERPEGAEIELTRRSVVTTTWGEWKRRHPKTQVLSLDTGHRRDYSEGAAYRDYFATDKLMFNVPKLDRRLKNKDEVLALVFPEAPGESLALAQKYLEKNPVHHDAVGPVSLVVFTDPSGANRVYETGGVKFKRWDGDRTAIDRDGDSWALSESLLQHEDGRALRRLPSHRAFWFGWFSVYPQTRLVR